MNEESDHRASFSDRLEKRRRLWWGRPRTWRRLGDFTGPIGRLPMRLVLHNRHTPDNVWRRGKYWQRKLNNKWNSREFALRHGCRVPELYWHGRRVRDLPLHAMPEQFVVRRTWGSAQRAVYVFAGGRELLRNIELPLSRVHDYLADELSTFSFDLILAEEFVGIESGRFSLPWEYKCYMFGEHIAAIALLRRSAENLKKYSCDHYTPSWDPIEEDFLTVERSNLVESPACLDEMIASSRRLSASYGCPVRIDFYATDSGCLFSEFSTVPALDPYITPFADELLGRAWQERFPGEV